MLTLIQEAALIKISSSINNALEDLSIKIERLNQKRILVNINKFPLDLKYKVIFENNKVTISDDSNVNVTTRVTGYDLTINLSLGGLIRSRLTSIEQSIRERDIEFSGDLNVAMELQSLFNSTDINLKDVFHLKLARQTSDLFAWQFITIVEKILTRINLKHDELAEQITDYLQTEKNILVNRIEVEQFMQDVDKLRDDVARLEAQIDRL